jgi:hypothetical protein
LEAITAVRSGARASEQGHKAGPTTPAPDAAPRVPVEIQQPRAKALPTQLNVKALLGLQRLVGNRATASLVGVRPRLKQALVLQRHTIAGVPGTPPPLTEEEETVPVQGSWGYAAKSAHSYSTTVQRKGKSSPRLGAVKLSASDLKADSSSTLNASVANPNGLKVAWTLTGPAGTKIDPNSGVVTAGADAGGKADKAKVKVTGSNAAAPGVGSSAFFTLWSSDAWVAKIDVKALLKSGPLVKKAYKASFNGVYDATYTPAKRLLHIEVPVQFDFPDDPISAKMSAKKKAQVHARLAGFRHAFISNTQRQWGRRFTFSMAREPKSFWGKLSPVRFAVKVFEPKNKAASYFTVHYKSKTAGRAGVSHPDVDLFKGDLRAQAAFKKDTLTGETTMLNQITNPVNVDAAGKLDAASQQTLGFIGDYVKRLRQPPVRLALVGKDAKKASRGASKAAIAASFLRSAGVTSPHRVSSSGAVDAADQRVHITPSVSARYINFQDVSAHEFGHMIGLPDEYPEGARKIGDKLRTYDRLVKAFGQDYADQVGKVTPSTASIMHGGNQVRVQHYIHFWDTLILTSNLHGSAPTKKFGDADWKING